MHNSMLFINTTLFFSPNPASYNKIECHNLSRKNYIFQLQMTYLKIKLLTSFIIEKAFTPQNYSYCLLTVVLIQKFFLRTNTFISRHNKKRIVILSSVCLLVVPASWGGRVPRLGAGAAAGVAGGPGAPLQGPQQDRRPRGILRHHTGGNKEDCKTGNGRTIKWSLLYTVQGVRSSLSYHKYK